MSKNKIGFWSVTSLVAGSQIGSGIFLLPATLASFGPIGLYSWILSGFGAIMLALVFGKLCMRMPKTGGPHNYVEEVFGRKVGFFVAWVYWLISWLSTPAVVIGVVSNLGEFIPLKSSLHEYITEIIIILIITWVNFKGVKTAGLLEFFFTILKILPLIIIPLYCISYINFDHFHPIAMTGKDLSALNKAALITMWGFIGVESATTPAGSVENPSKTIPRAIIIGTIIVAIVYIFGTFAIMGVLPFSELTASKSPYADVAEIVFGGNILSRQLVSLAVAIVCLGTLNAWILTSGQIAIGAAEDNLFPKFFLKTNKNDAPIWGIAIPVIGMTLMLSMTFGKDLIKQFNLIIDIATTGFLFVYLLCSISFFIILLKSNDRRLFDLVVAICATIFCFWMMLNIELYMLLSVLIIVLTGIPVFIKQKVK